MEEDLQNNSPQFDQQAWDEYDAASSQLQQADDERVELQTEQNQQKQQSIEQANSESFNEDGSAKSNFEKTDPKDFGLAENAQEGANAVVGGVVDIYNSVGSIPKFFDPEFYKSDKGNPYEFKAPWLVTDKPITRTRWGNIVRTVVEFGGGLVGVGKVGYAVKGLKWLSTASKTSTLGKAGAAAASGAVYDAISNQSEDQNAAAAAQKALVDLKPEWAGILEPIATNDDMSPAQRVVYNMVEGLGIGAVADLAFEGGKKGLKSLAQKKEKAVKALGGTDPNILEKNGATKVLTEVESAKKTEYEFKTKNLEIETERTIQKKTFAALKRQLKVPEGMTLKTFRELDNGQIWKSLEDAKKTELMQVEANNRGIKWGEADTTINTKKRAKANEDMAMEQLEFDYDTGIPRENPAYYKGGDVTDNQALTNSSVAGKGVIDQVTIRSDYTQKHGSPRGPLSEAQIRRMENGATFFTSDQLDQYAKTITKSPGFQKLYGANMSKEMANMFEEVTADLANFLEDSGHNRATDLTQDQLLTFVDSYRGGKNVVTGEVTDNSTIIEGIAVLNRAQTVAADVVVGQLLTGARDLAKAGLSVAGEVDVKAPGGLIDGIMARYSALSRMRAETKALDSFNLRKNRAIKAGESFTEPAPNKTDLANNASKQAAEEVKTFKTLLQKDLDDNLLETFMHFTASGNAKGQTFKDLTAFMKRKLHGYSEAGTVQRNSIVNEMMAMGMNSILSGPKTPVRATLGTGMGTILRPASTILGATGKSNDVTRRAAFAELAGMYSSLNDAWKKAVNDFQTYFQKEEGWRGVTENRKDQDWEAMKAFHEQYGSAGDKAAMKIADSLRYINKLPILSYGPRLMTASDTFFSQLIGRGRMRSLAFTETYEKAKLKGIDPSDAEFTNMITEAEKAFEKKVFSADGQLTDEMAKFSADEAKLTKELTGRMAKLNDAFDSMPFLKPFMLFMKTGVNAFEMTSKYTPILNGQLREAKDIFSLAPGDPALLKYGIKSAQDLASAQAAHRGRTAIGYGVVASTAMMALSGQITGNGPPDRGLRDAWMQAGWQPRSLKIGDKFVSYESLEPFNTMLSFIADIADSQKVMGDDWVDNWFGKVAYLVSANVTNKSFLAGLMQLQDLNSSDGARFGSVAANLVNNQIPLGGLRNEVGKLLAPGMRELESGFLDGIKNRNLWSDIMPGEDGTLPYRYDILNGSVLRDYDPMTRIWNSISPFYVNIGSTPTRELLFRSGLDLKLSFNTGPNGEPLNGMPGVKSKYQYYIGKQNLESKLEELFKNPQIVRSIQDMEEDRAANRRFDPQATLHNVQIRRILNQAKKQAWGEMQAGDQELQDLTQDSLKQKSADNARKSGQTEKANAIQELIKRPK